ncbi:MAG: hypothetical protein LUG50_00145 [Planctomycetaceae bacterium]|nr:hypothetical protein [Planctomycetaceae bacterium]
MQLRLKRLEDRIVFDAAPAAVADNAEPPPAETPDDGADRLVVVDQAVTEADWVDGPDDGTAVVVFDSRTDTLAELQDMISAACGDRDIAGVAFAGYGPADGADLSLDAVLALAGSGEVADLAGFLDALSDALADYHDGGGNFDPDALDDGFGQILEETTGMPFAALGGTPDGDAAATALDGGLDGGGDDADGDDGADDDDDVGTLGADGAGENYIEDNDIIHFEESDRVIGSGSAFREPGFMDFGQDLGGEAHKLYVEYTLYQNGLPLDLYDYLVFQNEMVPLAGNAVGMEIDGEYQPVYGSGFANGKFFLTLFYVTTDPDGAPIAPYYAVMVGDGVMVSADRFFDGDDIHPNIIFATTPDGTTGDEFSLEMTASATTSDGISLAGTYEKTVNLKFPVDDGDDDGSGGGTLPPMDDYVNEHDLIHFEESGRVIEDGSAFREPGYLEFGDDTGGQAHRLLVEFSLYKKRRHCRPGRITRVPGRSGPAREFDLPESRQCRVLPVRACPQ